MLSPEQKTEMNEMDTYCSSDSLNIKSVELVEGDASSPPDDCEVKSTVDEELAEGQSTTTSSSSSSLTWWRRFFNLLSYIGPSWLVCSAYIDPGSIVSDFQQGAYTGYQLLWITFLATIIGIIFQTLSFRLGLVTQKNLAQLCSEQYKSRTTSLVIWGLLEVCTVLVDVQAVVGSAVAFNALTGCPFWASCLVICALTLIVVIFYQFWPNYTELFAALLLIVLIICFSVIFFHALPPAGSVFYGWWVPEADSYTEYTALGIMGALMMPNAFFLHSDLMVKHNFSKGSSKRKIYYSSLGELVFSMLFTFFGNLMIICVFASAYFSSTCAHQNLANFQNNCISIVLDNGLQDLAISYGTAFQTFFLIGLIGSGLGSMINSTIAGQGITEGFLKIKIKFWQRLLLTRVITLIPTLLLAIIPGNGSQTASILNEWINVLVNILLPFALIPVVHLSRKEFMGDWKIHLILYYLLWVVSGVIVGINIYFLIGFIYEPDTFGDAPGTFPMQPWFYSLIGAVLIAYAFLLLLILRENIVCLWNYSVKVAKWAYRLYAKIAWKLLWEL